MTKKMMNPSTRRLAKLVRELEPETEKWMIPAKKMMTMTMKKRNER